MGTIGFIGLGIMGRPMALNLIRAGYRLRVYARRPESLAPLTEAGATACASPADVARQADVVITIVADTPDVVDVLVGDTGVLEGAAPGTVVIDMSTIAPEATRALAQRLGTRSVTLLDAPVSGGEQGAIDGRLAIMVGGPVPAVDAVRPILECLGTSITHVGDHGAGQVAKACNQLIVVQNIQAVAEAMLLATASGVDPARVRAAISGGFAGSRVLEVHGARMLAGDYRPGFKAGLHRKDLAIVQQTARELGVSLPGTALAASWLNPVNADDDSSALATVLARASGYTLAHPHDDV